MKDTLWKSFRDNLDHLDDDELIELIERGNEILRSIPEKDFYCIMISMFRAIAYGISVSKIVNNPPSKARHDQK